MAGIVWWILSAVLDINHGFSSLPHLPAPSSGRGVMIGCPDWLTQIYRTVDVYRSFLV